MALPGARRVAPIMACFILSAFLLFGVAAQMEPTGSPLASPTPSLESLSALIRQSVPLLACERGAVVQVVAGKGARGRPIFDARPAVNQTLDTVYATSIDVRTDTLYFAVKGQGAALALSSASVPGKGKLSIAHRAPDTILPGILGVEAIDHPEFRFTTTEPRGVVQGHRANGTSKVLAGTGFVDLAALTSQTIKCDALGQIGEAAGDGKLATQVRLHATAQSTYDPHLGLLFLGESGCSRQRVVLPDGRIKVILGNGNPAPSCTTSVPRSVYQVPINYGLGMQWDSNNRHLYVADGSGQCIVRAEYPAFPNGSIDWDRGLAYAFAGTGNKELPLGTSLGRIDADIAASVALHRLDVRLNYPLALAWDAERSTLYFTDFLLARVFAVLPSGHVIPLIGVGNPATMPYTEPNLLEDNVSLMTARFSNPYGLSFDNRDGSLYIGDYDSYSVRRASCCLTPNCAKGGEIPSPSPAPTPEAFAPDTDAGARICMGVAADPTVPLNTYRLWERKLGGFGTVVNPTPYAGTPLLLEEAVVRPTKGVYDPISGVYLYLEPTRIRLLLPSSEIVEIFGNPTLFDRSGPQPRTYEWERLNSTLIDAAAGYSGPWNRKTFPQMFLYLGALVYVTKRPGLSFPLPPSEYRAEQEAIRQCRELGIAPGVEVGPGGRAPSLNGTLVFSFRGVKGIFAMSLITGRLWTVVPCGEGSCAGAGEVKEGDTITTQNASWAPFNYASGMAFDAVNRRVIILDAGAERIRYLVWPRAIPASNGIDTVHGPTDDVNEAQIGFLAGSMSLGSFSTGAVASSLEITNLGAVTLDEENRLLFVWAQRRAYPFLREPAYPALVVMPLDVHDPRIAVYVLKTREARTPSAAAYDRQSNTLLVGFLRFQTLNKEESIVFAISFGSLTSREVGALMAAGNVTAVADVISASVALDGAGREHTASLAIIPASTPSPTDGSTTLLGLATHSSSARALITDRDQGIYMGECFARYSPSPTPSASPTAAPSTDVRVSMSFQGALHDGAARYASKQSPASPSPSARPYTVLAPSWLAPTLTIKLTSGRIGAPWAQIACKASSVVSSTSSQLRNEPPAPSPSPDWASYTGGPGNPRVGPMPIPIQLEPASVRLTKREGAAFIDWPAGGIQMSLRAPALRAQTASNALPTPSATPTARRCSQLVTLRGSDYVRSMAQAIEIKCTLVAGSSEASAGASDAGSPIAQDLGAALLTAPIPLPVPSDLLVYRPVPNAVSSLRYPEMGVESVITPASTPDSEAPEDPDLASLQQHYGLARAARTLAARGAAARRAAGGKPLTSSASSFTVSGATTLIALFDTRSAPILPSAKFLSKEAKARRVCEALRSAGRVADADCGLYLQAAIGVTGCLAADFDSAASSFNSVPESRRLTLVAYVGGVRASVLWMAPDGSQAHIQTPPFASACNTTAANGGCGYRSISLAYERAPLPPSRSLAVPSASPSTDSGSWLPTWLEGGVSVSSAVLTQAAAEAPLGVVSCPPFCPSCYPDSDPIFAAPFPNPSAAPAEDPLRWAEGSLVPALASVSSDAAIGSASSTLWLEGFEGETGSAQGLSFIEHVTPIVLPFQGASASSPPSGLYYTSQCVGYTDITSNACTNTSHPQFPLCAFGQGDSCRLCPGYQNGGDLITAVCPGGERAWPLAGYYTPSEDSGVILKCAPPASRCVGWDPSFGGMRCSVGYKDGSPSCSSCAKGYYIRTDGVCAVCPSSKGAGAAIAAIAAFAGVVMGIVLLVLAVTFVAARFLGGSVAKGAWRAVDLLVWVVIVLQTLAEAGKAASPGLPSIIAEAFKVLALTQLEGVGAPPACWELYPFAGDVIAMVFALLLSLPLLAAALSHTLGNGANGGEKHSAAFCRCFSVRQHPQGHSAFAFFFDRVKRLWPAVAVSGCALLYGPVANSVFRLLYCRDTVLTAAEVQTLSGAGQFAGNEDGVLTLPLLVYYPSFVCWTGDHRPAGVFAAITFVCFTVGFPLWTWLWLRTTVARVMRSTFRPAHLSWMLGDAGAAAAVLTHPEAVSYVMLSGALPSLAHAGAILAHTSAGKPVDGLPPGIPPAVASVARLEGMSPADCWSLVVKADHAAVTGLRRRYPHAVRMLLPTLGKERAVSTLTYDSRLLMKSKNASAPMTACCSKRGLARWCFLLSRAIFCGVTVSASDPGKPVRSAQPSLIIDASAAPSRSRKERRRNQGPLPSLASSESLPLPGTVGAALVDMSASLADDKFLAPWVDSSHRASQAFMRHVDMLCLGVLAALQNLWPRPASAEAAAGRGALVVLTLLATAFFAGTRSPYPRADPWKLSAKVGCLLLGALAAVLTHVTLAVQLQQPPSSIGDSTLNGHPAISALSILVGIGSLALLLTLAAGFVRSVVRGAKVEVATSAAVAGKAAAQAAASAAAAAYSAALEAEAAASLSTGDQLEMESERLAALVAPASAPLKTDRRIRTEAAARAHGRLDQQDGLSAVNPLRALTASSGARSSFVPVSGASADQRIMVKAGQVVEPRENAKPAAPWLLDGFMLYDDAVSTTDGRRLVVAPLPGLADSLHAFEQEAQAEAGAQMVATAQGEDFAYSFSLGGAAASAARRGGGVGGGAITSTK